MSGLERFLCDIALNRQIIKDSVEVGLTRPGLGGELKPFSQYGVEQQKLY